MGGGSHQRGRPFPSKARAEGEEDRKAVGSCRLQHYKETPFGRDVAVGGGGGLGSRGCSSEVEEGLMKECFTKRKAAEGTFDEKKKKAAVEGTFDEKKKAAATVPAEGILEAPAAAAEAGKGLTRLSRDIVDYILTWEPRPTRDPDEYYATMMNDPLKCFPQEHIDKTTAILRHLAETTKHTAAKFKLFQDWARAEFEAKGCVEVDDTYIAQRVLLRQAMTKEPWSSAALEEFASAMDSQRKEGISSN